MSAESLGVTVVVLMIFGIGFGIGCALDSCTTVRDVEKIYESRAVTNGCAIRVLDSASGEVKTVWKDGKL